MKRSNGNFNHRFSHKKNAQALDKAETAFIILRDTRHATRDTRHATRDTRHSGLSAHSGRIDFHSNTVIFSQNNLDSLIREAVPFGSLEKGYYHKNLKAGRITNYGRNVSIITR